MTFKSKFLRSTSGYFRYNCFGNPNAEAQIDINHLNIKIGLISYKTISHVKRKEKKEDEIKTYSSFDTSFVLCLIKLTDKTRSRLFVTCV